MTWWDNRIGRNANWGDSIKHPQRVWLTGFGGVINHRVLEVGYGTGKDYAGIRDKAVAYRGYDFTKSFQDVCLGRWPDGDFRLASVTSLPEPDRSWDLVFCRHLLEHVEDWRTALYEMFRVTDRWLAILAWRALWDKPTMQRNSKSNDPPVCCWQFNSADFMDELDSLGYVQTIPMERGGPIYLLSRE